MTIQEFARRFPYIGSPTEEQIAMGRLLEAEGKRFLVDFGYENAPQMASDLIDAEMATLSIRRVRKPGKKGGGAK